MDLLAKWSAILADLRAEYTARHHWPWIVGVSGGKDSTLLLQAVYEMLLEIAPPCRLCRTCPFRPGNERKGWEPGARTALIEGQHRIDWFMECHDKQDSPCAGFVGQLGREYPAVRLAVLRGRLKPPRPIPGAVRTFEELDERAAGAEGWT